MYTVLASNALHDKIYNQLIGMSKRGTSDNGIVDYEDDQIGCTWNSLFTAMREVVVRRMVSSKSISIGCRREEDRLMNKQVRCDDAFVLDRRHGFNTRHCRYHVLG